MSNEQVIDLSLFKPRDYQQAFIEAFKNRKQNGVSKFLLTFPRRAGKDLLAFNVFFRAALLEVGSYYYCLPVSVQARSVMWDGITNDGIKIIDYIPKHYITKKNEAEMKLTLVNQSIIRFTGSDNFDTTIVGSNVKGAVLSEFAMARMEAYAFLRPILAANGGFVIICSTPRGKNFYYNLFDTASKSDDWFCQLLTLDETKHIPLEEIEKDRKEGLISDDLIQQEYYCSFSAGVEGAFYTKYLDQIRLNSQLTYVPWNPGHMVHTAWDLGIGTEGHTAIVFFQVIGQAINIIDCYEGQDKELGYYINLLKEKPYVYKTHLFPHDFNKRELTTGMTVASKAAQLGLEYKILPQSRIQDGIEAVRSAIPRMWIDINKADRVIRSLENYRREYDATNHLYGSKPLKSQFNHMADAIRYMCVGLDLITAQYRTPEQRDKDFMKAKYGDINKNPLFKW